MYFRSDFILPLGESLSPVKSIVKVQLTSSGLAFLHLHVFYCHLASFGKGRQEKYFEKGI